MENLKAAFIAAGAVDASDCLKLIAPSTDDPATQVAAFRAKHPNLFHSAPAFDARVSTKRECDAQLRELARAEATRQTAAATARTIERLKQEQTRRDEHQGRRDFAQRQRAERDALAERHRRERQGRA